MKRILCLVLSATIVCAMLAGCHSKDGGSVMVGGEEPELTEPEGIAASDFSQTDGDMFTQRDRQNSYDEDGSVTINLDGACVSASDDSVKISESTVTITQQGCYIISGRLDDGMIVVDAPKSAKLQLVLDGANISSSSAALYIRQADKLFLTLKEGTENSLANAGSFALVDENNIDAALFSKEDLTINGTGSLTVLSPAGHGIVSKDDLVISSGDITVSAANHGLEANDSVRIAEASLAIAAGKDGIHAENTEDSALGFVYISGGNVKITAEGDGVSAGSYVQIAGGRLELLTGGGSENGSKADSGFYGGFGGGRPGMPAAADESAEESSSMKGIKAAKGILITEGTFSIDSADDAIHSDVSVNINGGSFTLASGDDAIHAEKELNVKSGSIHISECYEGLEALRVSVQGGDITITASDDGLNAAGGADGSGITGGRDGSFPEPGGRGGPPGSPMSQTDGEISISGGTLFVKAYGDGLDANGKISIAGGYTVVTGPAQGDTATLDYETSAIISGGTFIGTGGYGMAKSFSDCQQGLIAVSTGNQSAGTGITLADSDGNTLISYVPELPFAVVILSSPQIISGECYTISVGTAAAEFEAS